METETIEAKTEPGHKRTKLTRDEVCKAVYRYVHGQDATDEELTRSEIFSANYDGWHTLLRVGDPPA